MGSHSRSNALAFPLSGRITRLEAIIEQRAGCGVTECM